MARVKNFSVAVQALKFVFQDINGYCGASQGNRFI
jgi:hypothetical protein